MNELDRAVRQALDRARALLGRSDLSPVAALQNLTVLLAPAQYQVVQAFVVQRGGLIVQNGPFAGMRYLPTSAEGTVTPRLLGCYESELHDTVRSIVAAAPSSIVNIGCGEGYYAVGLARLLPQTRIRAFDMNPQAQTACARLATDNAVAERVQVEGECTTERLQALAEPGTVILCDCEGAELKLLDLERVPALARCRIVVECHDFMDETISATLRQRFEPTHEVTLIPNAWTNPNTIPLLRSLHPVQRCLAVWEGRPGLTPWLDLLPRS